MDNATRPAPSPVTRLVRGLWSYLTEIQLAGDRAGFSLLRRLWASGWLGRISLLVLLVGTCLTAYFITQPQTPNAETNPTVTPILILAAILFTFGWSLGLSAATRLPVAGYFFAAAYLAWFGILPLLALNRIFITLPFFWLLLNGWFVTHASTDRWRRLWLLLLCLGAGYLTFPGLSLGQFFPGNFNLPARLVLGLIYFALLANPRVLNTPRPLPRLEWLFLITFVLMGILLGASIRTSPTAWAVDEQTSLALGLSMVGLMWLILSAGAFDGAVQAGEWMTGRVHGIALSTRGKIVLVVVIAVVTVVESVLNNPTDLPLFILFFSNLLDPITFFTLSVHFWFGIIALVACTLALIVQRFPRLQNLVARTRRPHGESPESGSPSSAFAIIFGIWFGALLALLIIFGSYVALATTEIGPFVPLALTTALLLVVGLVWDLVKSGAGWSSVSPARLFGVVALVILALAITGALYGAGSPQVNLVATLNSFWGVFLIGIAMLALTIFSKWWHYESLSGMQLGALFVLGWLGTIPLLIVNPNIGWQMLAMPIWWLVVLALWGTALGGLVRGMDGVVAGGALALGFATMWVYPQSLLIPFIETLQDLQAPLDQLYITHSLLQPITLYFILASLVAGMVIGYLWFRVRVRRVSTPVVQAE